MPNPRSILKWLQYAPFAYELVKTIIPALPSPTSPTKIDATQAALAELERTILGRLADLEGENAKLRARLREVESLMMNLQLWLWVGGGTLIVLVLILLIAVLSRP